MTNSWSSFSQNMSEFYRMPAKELADSIFEVTRAQMPDRNKYTEVFGKPYSEVLLKAKDNGQFPEKLILSTPPFLGSRAIHDSFLSQTQVFDFEPLRKAIIGNLGEAVKNLQEALHQLPEEAYSGVLNYDPATRSLITP